MYSLLDNINNLINLNLTFQVYKEVDHCCNALSERLDKGKFFFGNK